MNLELEGKVAVITGGSDGIGKAAALSLSQEGAHVAIAARDQTRLDDAVSEISTQTGNPLMGISTDVRDESSVVSLIAQVTDEWDRLDILVNNAGTSSTSRLEDMSNEKMTADIELKVYGAVYGTRHALPYLKPVSYTHLTLPTILLV